jgi:cobalt-precorrin 5A hydrolase
MIAAGFGCRPGAPASDFVTALAAARAIAEGAVVAAIAIPHFRATEAGIVSATELWALPVTIVDRAALEQACGRATTHSALALEHIGLSSVAESAALAAAGPDSWLLAKRVSAGSVTCAIAMGAALP